MKTILILGANGFIGKSLKKKLKKSYNLLCPSKKKLRVENFNQINKFINKNKIDIIINLTGQISKNENKMYKTIVLGNKNIVDILKKNNLKIHIYFFSTTLVYGYSNKMLNENNKAFPKINYSNYKNQAEKYYADKKLNYRIFRISHVYTNKKDGIIKNLIRGIIKNKKIKIPNFKMKRNYIHLDDLAKIIQISIKTKLKKRIYNICHENFALKEIINFLDSKIESKLKYIDKKIDLFKLSSQFLKKPRILKEIKYEPKIKLKEFLIKNIKK